MSSNNVDPAQDQSRFQPGNRPHPPSQNPPGENPTEQMPYQPQPNQQQTWAGHNGPGQGQYVPVLGQNQQHSYAQLQGNACNQYGHPRATSGIQPLQPSAASAVVQAVVGDYALCVSRRSRDIRYCDAG
ncbi:hypothetical protein J2S70_000568 [Trueperella bonasi]|uniref:Uncharacterized protein n=1 Tax=Trueperella bonasi TaxID=312286 RepID=A0ABT9NF15_9ACTO|nr:hypothetical protein [Trueperella bonasi]